MYDCVVLGPGGDLVESMIHGWSYSNEIRRNLMYAAIRETICSITVCSWQEGEEIRFGWAQEELA